jgi:hypothetical protein
LGNDEVSCGVGTTCKTLDYAIYSSLDKNADEPTININGNTVLYQSVDTTGVNINK